MKKHHCFAFAALAAFVASYIFSSFAGIAGAIGVIFLYKAVKQLEGVRNTQAIFKRAFEGFEEIIGDEIWTTKDATIVASERVDDVREPGPIRYDHICKTKNGSWFVFHVAVDRGIIVDRYLTPCDSSAAKRRLEHHKEAYIKNFGQPVEA